MTDQYMTKAMTTEELLNSQHDFQKPYEMRVQTEGDMYPELQKGKVLTRYFTHGNQTYLVFEEKKL